MIQLTEYEKIELNNIMISATIAVPLRRSPRGEPKDTVMGVFKIERRKAVRLLTKETAKCLTW